MSRQRVRKSKYFIKSLVLQKICWDFPNTVCKQENQHYRMNKRLTFHQVLWNVTDDRLVTLVFLFFTYSVGHKVQRSASNCVKFSVLTNNQKIFVQNQSNAEFYCKIRRITANQTLRSICNWNFAIFGISPSNRRKFKFF